MDADVDTQATVVLMCTESFMFGELDQSPPTGQHHMLLEAQHRTM